MRVTVDNFRRAESDTYFGRFVKEGAFGRLAHRRNLTPVDEQIVIRLNRDTLYSCGVFDLDAGPVVVTLPASGSRYVAVQVIDEDHYTHEVMYAPGTLTLTKERIGTRYVGLLGRTFVDPQDAADLEAAHALQNAMRVEQAMPGSFEVPEWDAVSLKKVREALLALVGANGGLESTRMFGSRAEVDPVQHLLGTAAAWGGNPVSAALYLGAAPPQNDGQTAYRLTVRDVPVDGFWSICVYNAKGFFEPNQENAYSVNNVTAKKSADGSVVVQFGGQPGEATNHLPIMAGWNYTVRLYRPRKEILDGTWLFPEPQPVP